MSTNLTALSPVDGRYQSKTSALAPYLSEYGLIKYRVIIEIRWFQALSNETAIKELPVLSSDAHAFLEKIITDFSVEDAETVKQFEQTTNHDVKAVEYFLKAQFAAHKELAQYQEFIHFACTSEDINNLSYALMCQDSLHQVVLPLLNNIVSTLKNFAKSGAELAMLSRTHGQAATPTTLGKEYANVIARLEQVLPVLRKKMLGKINGAVGNFNAHYVAYPEVDWLALSDRLIGNLNLEPNHYTTQIEPHDQLAELCHGLIRCHTILIDLSRDTWGYISLNYLGQKVNSSETGSSTMPHKVNPIDFENAEGNLGLANAIFSHLAEKLPISRWQRDLSDSTVLRALGEGFGHQLVALHALIKGLGKITFNEQEIKNDLSTRYELLAEPLQTVMRRYGIEKPYEKLKALTRGQDFTQQSYEDFVQTLEIPQEAKSRLLALKPETYTGIAAELAAKITSS